ncbi:hypothetical protein R6Q59_000551 [Mikania micrantha]
MLQKKPLIPYWRYIAHVFMVYMSGNKGTFHMLNKEQSSAFVTLAMNWGYNFSKFILNEMKSNLKGSKSKRFMMYPRFLQMIFDERNPVLQRGVVTRDLKLLSVSTIPLMMQNRDGKYKFEGLHPLKKFGQFAEIEDADTAEEVNAPNVVVEEEHDVEAAGSKSADDDVYLVKFPEYEDVLMGEEPDVDFEFEIETQEVEKDLPEQMNLLTTENLEALLEHVKMSVGNPPSAPSFTNQELPLDVDADLVPRKRRRRDPRPGVVVREPETEHVLVTQIQTTTTEPTEPSPQVKESVAGSSSHTEDLDYDSFLAVEQVIRADKGTNVLPEDEPIDMVKLQSRVFEFKQDSLSHTLLIQEMNIDNELKDKKIKDLETIMGHLSAIVLDLKKKLRDKFKGEFANESSPSTTAKPHLKLVKLSLMSLREVVKKG